MPTVGPIPLFHATAVLVDINAAIPLPEARRVMAAINGLVRRLSDTHAKVDELVEQMPLLVAQYGYTARLIARMPEAIEFSVTRQ